EMIIMKVLHVDDDELNRSGMDDWLMGMGFEVQGVAGPTEAFVVLDSWEPDLIILDLVMRDEETGQLDYVEPVGVSTAVILHQTFPHIHLLIYTSHFNFIHFPDIHTLLQRTSAGFGYLLRTHTKAEILEVIQRVGQGKTYLDPEAEQQYQQLTHQPDNPYNRSVNETIQPAIEKWPILTPSHKHIVSLIAHGKNNQEIALERDTSIHTINKQIREASERLSLADKDSGVPRVWMILVYWAIHYRAQQNGTD
ncbi:MAG: response regulator transcription factor, partial [Anaerolineales bacterium]|nr:response regulator transcription factor [Anaerolineales bacterium]